MFWAVCDLAIDRNIKLCLKLSISATKTLDMLRMAFGDEAVNRTKVFEWDSRFKAGRHSFEDDKSSA